MTDFISTFARGELVLLILIVAVLLLLALVVLFALYAVWLRYRNEARAEHRGALERTWSPLILGCMETRFPCSAVWDRVDPDDGLHFVRVVMRYAERVRGDSLETLRELVAPFLDDLVDRMDRAHMEDRALVVQVLGTLGLDEHMETVIRGLDDPSPLVSMVAARAMARNGGAEHANLVLDRLARYSNWSRGYLAAMLASMGTGAAPMLRTLYSDEKREPWVRAVAADALRWLNDLPAQGIARQAITHSTDREILAQSLRLLSRIGEPRDVVSILPLLESPDPVVRGTAVQALGQLGSSEHGTAAREAVDDSSPWVAFHAAHALGALGRRDLLEDLVASRHNRATLALQVISESQG